MASKVLPPLSDQDNHKLSVILPLLSASFECNSFSSQVVADQLHSISNDLVTYALSSDYDSMSRSAAASCLNASLVEFGDRTAQACPVRALLEKVVLSTLKTALGSFPAKVGEATSVVEIQATASLTDCLNVIGLLVSTRTSISPTKFVLVSKLSLSTPIHCTL